MQRKEHQQKIKPRDASHLRVGIAVSSFNKDITESMYEGAHALLREWGVHEKNIFVARTYGSFELPHACQKLIKKHRLHAVVAIGCIVKGETRHDEYLAHAAAQGLMRLMLDTAVAVGFGIITTQTLAQAKARSRGMSNHGTHAAVAALESALS